MTPAQQATAELHAAFFATPYTATLVARRTLDAALPRRQYDLMKREVQELKDLGMSRLGKGDKR